MRLFPGENVLSKKSGPRKNWRRASVFWDFHGLERLEDTDVVLLRHVMVPISSQMSYWWKGRADNITD
jgi:hypothetical protein